MEPRPMIVRIDVAPGHAAVPSPILGRSGVFVSVELWAGDEPGGALRRLDAVVLGDVVRLVSEVDGAAWTVVLRHVRVEPAGPAPRLPMPASLPAELVPLLARAPGSATGLALVERVFSAGHRFAWSGGDGAVLRDLEGGRHGG